MAKKKSNRINPVILVLIYCCLLYAMYMSLSTIALGFWGESVMGTVDSYDSRLDDSSAGVNRSRTVSKGYYFTVNGKEYKGYVIYMSDEAWPRLKNGETRSERISYFSFFPYINKPSALVEFSRMGELAIIYHVLAPFGYLFLLLLVTGTLKKEKKKKSKKAASTVLVTKNNYIRDETDMYCKSCGNKLSEDAAFCANCGAETNKAEVVTAHAEDYVPQGDGNIRNTGLVGFSERCNSPEIIEAARKNRKSSFGCMWILVLVPLIGFPIAGLLMEDFPFGESVAVGVIISLVMLVSGLIRLSGTKKPIWEGTVVNKYSKVRSEHRGGEDDNYRTYTEFTTVINTDIGKKKKIIERDSGRNMYDYLSVGDRVRFHPKFETYEKYDKSKDKIIYCNVCSMMNPIQKDRCKRCNNLLFK